MKPKTLKGRYQVVAIDGLDEAGHGARPGPDQRARLQAVQALVVVAGVWLVGQLHRQYHCEATPWALGNENRVQWPRPQTL